MTRRTILPLLFGLGGVAILLVLGTWQLLRLEWKTELLTRIEARLAASPVPVPEAPAPEEERYLRVRAEGEIGAEELHVYTSVPPHGVGYRVIVPLTLGDGRRVLLDRGFVSIGKKDAARLAGPIAVEGALDWPRESDFFTSPPDLAANIWFARDVPAMAAALGTEPVMIVAAASDDPAAPLPLPVTPDLPNDHLGYAITWFGMAAAWAGMSGHLLWRIARRIE